MELSDLHIFRTVAREGGIVRAARRLHRVQSNVTTRIRKLEQSLGTQLFIRTRQRLVLSASGQSLLVYADRLLRLAEEARSAATDHTPRGLFRIGSLESTAASHLPEILGEFHARFPEVVIELSTGTNDALTDAVRKRSVDAAFVVEEPDDDALESLPSFGEHLVLISEENHVPIKSRRDVTGDSIISFPSGCAYRRVLEGWLGRQALITRRVLELSSYHAIVACVSSGAGIALIPESVLDVVNAGRVAIHPLPRSYSRVTTPLIWRAGETSPCIIAMCEFLDSRRLVSKRVKRQLSAAVSR